MSSSVARNLIRIFIFLMTFTLEVRVHAEVVQLRDAVDPAQEPAGCLEESSVCAVRTKDGQRFTMTAGANELVLDQSSTIIRLGAAEAKLVWGTVWVKAKGDFIVRTEYGDAKVADGEFWITKSSERITVSATTANVEITPRGSAQKIFVEPGEENWISRVDAKGVAQTGLPKAIAFQEHIGRWARLYGGGKKSFEKDVQAFHETWQRASERAAGLHRDMMVRKIASIEEEKARREAEKKHQAEEERKLREMFRRKVLGDE